MGISLNEIRSMGGGANSKIWCEIKSSVTGKKVVTLKENETACLGSAIFAGIGIGIFKDTVEATDKLVETNKSYIGTMVEYKNLYKEYKEKEKSLISAVYTK